MRSLAVLATAVGLVATIGAQAPQTPVFRGGVSLIAIDVNVLDKDGKPVPGLTADDFDVKLDGHVQSVRTASYEHSEVATMAAAPSTPMTSRVAATNTTAAPEPRTFVMLFDDLSLPPTRGKDILFAGSRFVALLPATDMVGYATTSGTTAVNPTRNRAPVQAALRHASGQDIDLPNVSTTTSASGDQGLPLGRSEALDIAGGNDSLLRQVVGRDCFGGNISAALLQSAMQSPCAQDVQRKVRQWAALIHQQIERQISGYTAVVRAMAGVPGRKVLMLMTDGLLTSERGKDGTIALEEIGRAAAAYGVEFSVLYATPDDVSMTSRSPEQAALRRADGVAQMSGVQTVADLTGGTFWRVMGQPDRFFDFVGAATSGIYHLGVEAPPGDAKKDFALSVHVKRSDVSAHANRVAMLPTTAVAPSADDQVRDAITTGTPHYAIPMSVSALVRRGASASELAISTNVAVPGRPPGPLTFTFSLMDESGAVRTGRATVSAPNLGDEYRVSTSLPAHGGAYILRFAVQDASGRVGSLETHVNAQLARAGSVSVSDMVTAWSGADGKPQFLALDEIPTAATSIGGLVELYPESGAVPKNIQVKWDLLDEAQKSVATSVTSPVAAKDRLIGHAEFAAAEIKPGAYELRATILIGGQAAGSISAPLHKGS